jgi:uridine kinase
VVKVIAIGGEPGAGKSTLMWKVINRLNPEPKFKEYKLVPYHQKDNIYILGKYEEGETFSGTDRMSMSVQPEAIKFLDTLPKDSIVLYEGDRLFTSSFLEHCHDKHELQIIYLQTTKEQRILRYAQRGSNQNETWLAGRESKVNNILSNMVLMFVTEKFPHMETEHTESIVEYIMNQI